MARPLLAEPPCKFVELTKSRWFFIFPRLHVINIQIKMKDDAEIISWSLQIQYLGDGRLIVVKLLILQNLCTVCEGSF